MFKLSPTWISTLRKILLQNLEKQYLPLPIPKSICYEELKSLNLPKKNEVIIYTSCMYQLAPYISELVDLIEKFRLSESATISKIASTLSTITQYILKPNPEMTKRYLNIVRKVIEILRVKLGLNFGFLYDDEPYSGALLYDLGFEDDFKDYVRKVIKIFRDLNVKKIITIDPHTHYMLSKVYPEYEKVDFEVVNYLELILNVDLSKNLDVNRVVIHDSCLYSRYLDMYDVYRNILRKCGFEIVEDPLTTHKETAMCCGGPIESILPKVTKLIAYQRLKSLAELCSTVVTLCPICLLNLSKVNEFKVNIYDLIEVIK